MTEKDNYKVLNIDGEEYRTLFTEKFEKRTVYSPPDKCRITSFIPGTIEQIFIKEGQKVTKGEKLLILEAMKMKNLLIVPFDGIISSILIKEGQKVPKGELLVRIEEV